MAYLKDDGERYILRMFEVYSNDIKRLSKVSFDSLTPKQQRKLVRAKAIIAEYKVILSYLITDNTPLKVRQ